MTLGFVSKFSVLRPPGGVASGINEPALEGGGGSGGGRGVGKDWGGEEVGKRQR